MTEVAQFHSESEEEPQSTQLTSSYTQIQKVLDVEEPFTQARSECYFIETKQKSVTGKMRSKLLSWLQKLSIVIFKFHRSTFLTAVLIIDQSLQKNDELPAFLQLLGCAALFIASKLNEEIIVAPESYSIASCNIYSKKQLLQKQVALYSQIDWKKIRRGPLRAAKLGCQILKMEESVDRVLEVLGVLIKQQLFCLWKINKLIYVVLCLARASCTQRITNEMMISLAGQL